MAPVSLSSSTAGGDSSSASDKCLVQKYLTNCKSWYACIHCRTHLADHDELVSRSFQGNRGRAYLFNSVINISCGPAMQRQLNTGTHAVADIRCSNCTTILGWKYEKAYVETQKYKEGKYIIEIAHAIRENRHLELDKGQDYLASQCRSETVGSRRDRERQLYRRQEQNFKRKLDSLSPPYSSRQLSPDGSSSNEENGTCANLQASGLSDANDNYNGIDDLTDEDYDNDLMFPLFEDLYSDRSSYPGSLYSSHFIRNRRSIYLDSTPYDWKFTESSNEPGGAQTTGEHQAHDDYPRNLLSGRITHEKSTINSSISTSHSSDLAASTSSSCSAKYSSGKKHRDNSYRNRSETKSQYEVNSPTIASDDHSIETQFDCELDRTTNVNTNHYYNNESSRRMDEDFRPNNQIKGEQQYDHQIRSEDPGSSTQQAVDLSPSSSSCVDENSSSREISDSESSHGDKVFQTRDESLSIDDDEFYDCCTDHDVSNT